MVISKSERTNMFYDFDIFFPRSVTTCFLFSLTKKNNMKIFTKIALIAPLAFFAFKTSAQSTYEKGDFLLNPSVTLGWYDYGYGLNRTSVVPPVGLNFEYHVAGVLGIGLEGTYMSRKYEDFNPTSFTSSYDYSYKAISARVSFHYLDLIRNWFPEELSSEQLDKLDLYVTASSGYQWINSKRTWRDGDLTSDPHEEKLFESSFTSNFAGGVRYYVSDNFGVFAEGGRNSFGWVKIGATLKF
jgi:hypothetical protein